MQPVSVHKDNLNLWVVSVETPEGISEYVARTLPDALTLAERYGIDVRYYQPAIQIEPDFISRFSKDVEFLSYPV